MLERRDGSAMILYSPGLATVLPTDPDVEGRVQKKEREHMGATTVSRPASANLR
jgi:hypothetical protein